MEPCTSAPPRNALTILSVRFRPIVLKNSRAVTDT